MLKPISIAFVLSMMLPPLAYAWGEGGMVTHHPGRYEHMRRQQELHELWRQQQTPVERHRFRKQYPDFMPRYH